MQVSVDDPTDELLYHLAHLLVVGTLGLMLEGPGNTRLPCPEGGQVPEPPSPTVRRRRLAAELRRLRERAELTGDQVARQMRWSASKLSRFENAHTVPGAAEIRKLLTLYDVEESYADDLLALAREAAGKGWWETFSSTLPPLRAALQLVLGP